MPRANYRQFRFTDQELGAYEALAKRANLPLATWVREKLNLIVSLSSQNLLPCGHEYYRNGRCAEMSCLNYINKHKGDTDER